MRIQSAALLLLLASASAVFAGSPEGDYFLSHRRVTALVSGNHVPSTVATTAEFVRHFPIGHQGWKCSGQLVREGGPVRFALRCPGYGNPKVPMRFAFAETGRGDLELQAVQFGDRDLDQASFEGFARNPFSTYSTLQWLMYDPSLPVHLAGSGTALVRLGRLPDAMDRLRRDGFECSVSPAAEDDALGLSCRLRDEADRRNFDYTLRVEWGRRYVLEAGSIGTAGGGRVAFTEDELRLHATKWFSPG